MSTRVKGIQRGIALLAIAAVLGTFCLGGQAQAADAGAQTKKVLVLPFQMDGIPADAEGAADFSSHLATRIGYSGLEVIPYEKTLELLKSRNVSTIDAATARSLATAAGATHVVFGSVNQAGTSLSVDARLMDAKASAQAQPLFVEQRSGEANIGYAADELAAAVATHLPSYTEERIITPSAHDAPQSAVDAANVEDAPRTQGGGTGPVIAGVEVRGTKHLDPDVVLMRLSSRKGDRADATTIDHELKRIWELGYFSDVQVKLEHRPEGTVLVYTVIEKPRLQNVIIQGAKEIDADDVIATMTTKSGSVLNEGVLSDDIIKILEMYRKKGFYLARVDQQLTTDSAGASLTINIDEGKQLYIKEVKIDGVSALDESDVKGQLMLTERGILSWITGTGILKEELIERDSSAINAYYLDRGYMDITVAAPKIDYQEDGIVISFPVHEGPQYKIGNVTFEGDLIDSEESLRKLMKTDELAGKHDPFNLSAMQDDTKALTDYYADYGYAFADINAHPRRSMDGSNTVDIEYSIQKKSKVYVRRVFVEGNNKTRDNVILREMRITDGEQFEGAKLRRSTERLNRLGFFEVAEAELIPTEREDEVDLKVRVKEQPTGALMAGVGYSTFSQVGVAATIMEKNLWGKGYYLSLQAAFSGRRDAYTLTFTNPRVNDTDLTLTTSLYHWRDDFVDYVKRTTGGIVRVSYPIGEYTSVGVGYRLDRYKIYDLEDDASEIIRKYATGDRWSSVGLARIVRDTITYVNNAPTGGTRNSFDIEYGGGAFGGDDDFITLIGEHHSYYQLWQGHVLHARVKGQIIFENGSDEVPVFERFWMGGMNSVRGYDSRDIVPRDPKTGDRIGGTRSAFANLEYIWTINSEVGLYAVPFFDVGFNIDADRDYKWDDEIKKSAGLELRWRSPMGDLRFSYGIPFDEDRKGNRDGGRFEFAMGQMF